MLKLIKIFLFFTSAFAFTQTTLDQGDIFVVGVNSSNDCDLGFANDVIYLVALKDIENGTTLDLTDNGWERAAFNYFGTTEGMYRFTRTGGTILAGTIFKFEFTNSNDTTVVSTNNPQWSYINLSIGFPNNPAFSLRSAGDQFFIMQGGSWSMSGQHRGTYSGGRLLYGFNTKPNWLNLENSTTESALPNSLRCYSRETDPTSDFSYYNGPRTPASPIDWYIRFSTDAYWANANSCNDFFSNFTLTSISIIEEPQNTQTVCQNDGITTLKAFDDYPSGDYPQFQWAESTFGTNGPWSPIFGATNNMYQPPSNLEETRYYRCVISLSTSCHVTKFFTVIITPEPKTSPIIQTP